MTSREIVRRPDVLDGRWHFDGTTVAVAAVRSDHASADIGPNDTYLYSDLTGAEIADALDFVFPILRESWMDVHYASVMIHCECGEDTPRATTWPDALRIECPCGRIWLVEIIHRLVTQQTTVEAD